MGGIFDETLQNLGENSVYALMFWYINRKLFFKKNKTKAKIIHSESEKELIENTHNTPESDIDKMSPREVAEYLVAEQLREEYTPKVEQDKKQKLNIAVDAAHKSTLTQKNVQGATNNILKV